MKSFRLLFVLILLGAMVFASPSYAEVVSGEGEVAIEDEYVVSGGDEAGYEDEAEDTTQTDKPDKAELARQADEERKAEKKAERDEKVSGFLGKLFGTVLKKGMDNQSRIRDMRVVERYGNSITIDVAYKEVYEFDGVRIKGYVMRAGQRLAGMESTVASLNSMSGRATIRLTWADAEYGKEERSDQIEVALYRGDDVFKTQTFDLRKNWSALSDVEDDAGEELVLDAGETSSTVGGDSGQGSNRGTATGFVVIGQATTASTVAPSVKLVPLKLYWNVKRGDNSLVATPRSAQVAKSSGYRFVRVEGYVYPKQVSGTVPLKLYWNAKLGDNFLVATAQGQRSAKRYRFVRVEGYVYPKQVPGTVPLKLYWNVKRGDNSLVATPRSEQIAKSSGYRFVRVEGYVFTKAQGNVGAPAHRTGTGNTSVTVRRTSRRTYNYTATTLHPVKKSGRVKVGSLTWNCSGAMCKISGPLSALGLSTCKALAKEVGRIGSYGYTGKRLTASQLNQCNSALLIYK